MTRSTHESACSLLLINLIQIINLIILVVVVRIENALSVRFGPRFVIMEFVIEQVVVLGLGDISFFAHGFSDQQKESGLYRQIPSFSQQSAPLGRVHAPESEIHPRRDRNDQRRHRCVGQTTHHSSQQHTLDIGQPPARHETGNAAWGRADPYSADYAH